MSILGFEKKHDIVIIDDFYPNVLTGFRIAEYNYILSHINRSKVLSTSESFNESLETYSKHYKQLTPKISRYKADEKIKTKLFYTVFLNNAYEYLPIFEKNKSPFIFTLYPGGGFWLNDDTVKQKLIRVFSSRYFRKVIVTQSVTRDYLINNGLCKMDQIEFIFGVVTDSRFYLENSIQKQYYLTDKNTFDLAFVAHKYMKYGADKGYDLFIQAAKILEKKYDNIHFHVVGNFDKNDYAISGIEDKVFFYGSQDISFFPKFYSEIDTIISPTVPFKLYPGNFDGFPTGCCTDAALSGVAVFTSDPLNLNTVFRDNIDIKIIPTDPKKIAGIIDYYYRNPKELYEMSKLGTIKFNEVYSLENQMNKRMEILQHQINSYKNE